MDEQNKKTMSIAEMRKMLGLGKTESYWLVHRNFFETIMVNGKMRVVIDSFEKWYAGQVKHRKVKGPPPGAELKARSYSPQEIAEILGIDDASVYYLIKRDNIPVFYVDTWKRVRKEDFEAWYRSQDKHRTKEDRERDAELEASSMTLPEAARELGLDRYEGYALFNARENRGAFQFVVIAGRKRVTRESFERWYEAQSEYRKVPKPPEKEDTARHETEEAAAPLPVIDPNKENFKVSEVAVILNMSEPMVRELIREGDMNAFKAAGQYRIDREEIDWWLMERRRSEEMEVVQ